jgi:hypothetical protein
MMDEIVNGGPAFPQTCLDDPCHPASAPGMSLRDWFAGQALAALISHNCYDYKEAALHAYKQADAMLEARKKI